MSEYPRPAICVRSAFSACARISATRRCVRRCPILPTDGDSRISVALLWPIATRSASRPRRHCTSRHRKNFHHGRGNTCRAGRSFCPYHFAWASKLPFLGYERPWNAGYGSVSSARGWLTVIGRSAFRDDSTANPDFSCGLAVSGGGGAGWLVGLLVAGGYGKSPGVAPVGGLS